jgi:CBS domain-containing protein
MKVREIMNKAVVIDHEVNLKEAAQIMSSKNIGSLIVLNKDKIVGIITEADIIKNISDLGNRISSAMSKKVFTIDYKESIDCAAEMMTQNKIKRLPVVNNGKLVGIITATDIIANSEDLNEDFFFE